MIFINLLSLVWIAISAYLWGHIAMNIHAVWKRQGERQIRQYEEDIPSQIRELCLTVVAGLCSLTVFAEYFSLIGGVGFAASLIVLLGDFLGAWIFRKEVGRKIYKASNHIGSLIAVATIVLLLAIFVGIPTLTVPVHYDTYLYHAQAIRWIEEYGVVPGLGNLHNRLAYNSSFMCLQALFSLKWLTGVSQHTVNGFWVWLMGGYATLGMKAWHERKFRPSDGFRLILLIYMFEYSSVVTLSSPGTDLLALGLMIFLFAEWLGLMEDHETDISSYAFLCILAVFAVTVKLSVGAMPLLILYPLVSLIKKKQWKRIGGYVLTCVLVVLPFLIRNVILSGYLIYPYPELDLFQVDWKMPTFTALFDRYEIRVWGQGVRDINKWNAPITEWFPAWLSSIDSWKRMLLIANGVSIPIVLWNAAYEIRNKRDGRLLHITFVILAGLMLWLTGSPDIRYGGGYLWMLPMLCLGVMLSKIPKSLSVSIVVACAVLVGMRTMIKYDLYLGTSQLRGVHDYYNRDCEQITFEGTAFYIPAEGDQTGYDPFPSLPYAKRLELIEMRGETIRQGFRMKEEYRNQNVSTYGTIDSDFDFLPD